MALARLLGLMALLACAAPAWAEDGGVAVTSIPKVLVRSPNPLKLAEFYKALGFAEVARSAQSVNFYLEGNVGALEVMQMDSTARPSGPKTSRTQQGVVAIFEVTDQAALVARAKAAGATLIERWDATDRPATIYYIGDPENNVLGFAARHHHPRIKTP